MKTKILFTILGLLYNTTVMAGAKCFLAKEHNQVLIQEGDCKTRYTPQSTFKIPLSLMGYDTKILESEILPTFPFKESYEVYVNTHKGDHNPKTWMRDSCVWYSQVLTQKMGMEKFTEYVKKFNYGNQDVSGEPGKENGLTHAWLSSSLEISPEEQTQFLQKLIDNKLPASVLSHEMTKKILYIQELPGGWKLYGKTGNGQQLSADKTQKFDLQHGWFVGWIEKEGRAITFANHIVDDKKHDTFASLRARNDSLLKLWSIINDLEKIS